MTADSNTQEDVRPRCGGSPGHPDVMPKEEGVRTRWMCPGCADCAPPAAPLTVEEARPLRYVSQTRFGGSQHPPEEQGNCVQAAIASLLNIPLVEAFDAVAAYTVEEAGGSHWFHALERWARERGLRVWWQERALSGVMGLADVNSIDLPGDRHVVVARGLEIVHDPNPRYRERNVTHTFPTDDPCFIYFMPLDPAVLREAAVRADAAREAQAGPDTHTRDRFEEEMTVAAYQYEGRYPKKDAPARRHGFAEGARWADVRAFAPLQEARDRADGLRAEWDQQRAWALTWRDRAEWSRARAESAEAALREVTAEVERLTRERDVSSHELDLAIWRVGQALEHTLPDEARAFLTGVHDDISPYEPPAATPSTRGGPSVSDLWPGCTNCGEGHAHPDTRTVVHINRPSGEETREELRCPLHLEVESVTVRLEEWYGAYYRWDCGVTGKTETVREGLTYCANCGGCGSSIRSMQTGAAPREGAAGE